MSEQLTPQEAHWPEGLAACLGIERLEHSLVAESALLNENMDRLQRSAPFTINFSNERIRCGLARSATNAIL
jgi:hypothetical protein